MTEERKWGVRLPAGFNGSQEDAISAIFQMAEATIQTNKLYKGWTLDLERSPIGEWRFTIKEKK